ncbi:hypothetical protein [Burkholderia ambifaria]|uniref:hypothetical protein n=1 Tax=Burkholderia ambifaria TaxID=152480 RepID=UPI0015882C79|nr:hypothetical protein [Burkholderia ambifaria]
MLYRFGSTRNPSDQYLRVYSEHRDTRADCGALHRIPRRRFVAIAKETVSGSMIGLRRIRLVRRIRFAFSPCALFRFHSARCDALRSPLQARAGRSNGRAAAPTWLADPRSGGLNRIFVKLPVREDRSEALECAVLLFCFNRRIRNGRRAPQAGLSATTSIEGSTRRYTMP